MSISSWAFERKLSPFANGVLHFCHSNLLSYFSDRVFVQFHPEELCEDNMGMSRLFEAFVAEAAVTNCLPEGGEEQLTRRGGETIRQVTNCPPLERREQLMYRNRETVRQEAIRQRRKALA